MSNEGGGVAWVPLNQHLTMIGIDKDDTFFMPGVCHHLIELTTEKAPQSICLLTPHELPGVTGISLFLTIFVGFKNIIYFFFTLPKDCTVQCNHSLISLSLSSICL